MQRLLNKIVTEEDDQTLEEEEIEEMYNIISIEYGDILQDNLE